MQKLPPEFSEETHILRDEAGYETVEIIIKAR